jgi:hypothetical protein
VVVLARDEAELNVLLDRYVDVEGYQLLYAASYRG